MRNQQLAEIIDKNWFQDMSKGNKRVWSFHEDLMSSSNKVIRELSILYADYKGGEANSISQNELSEKSFLVKFLHCITLSEYRFDSLLLSRNTRDKEIEKYANCINLPLQEVLGIYRWWHSGARKKVFK